MRPSLEHELAIHARALRALARLLVGEQHVDDLVQDTALQALAGPPPRPTGLRGWLLQVLRHRASKHQRGERRRLARQAQVPPPEPQISPARIAEQREAVQRLHTALMACPEPYLGTLLLRFFEDLTPTAIAQRTGVPLATVKSRLQRGLALLRERLDHDGAHDWRPALCTAFGLERALPVAGAAITSGVLLMGTGVKLALGGGAAALVAAAFMLFGGGAPPIAPTPGASDGPGAVAVAAATQRVQQESALDGEQREIAAPSATKAGAAFATIAGRCVDEQGQPLAGGPVAKPKCACRPSGIADAEAGRALVHARPAAKFRSPSRSRTTSRSSAWESASRAWRPRPSQSSIASGSRTR